MPVRFAHEQRVVPSGERPPPEKRAEDDGELQAFRRMHGHHPDRRNVAFQTDTVLVGEQGRRSPPPLKPANLPPHPGRGVAENQLGKVVEIRKDAFAVPQRKDTGRDLLPVKQAAVHLHEAGIPPQVLIIKKTVQKPLFLHHPAQKVRDGRPAQDLRVARILDGRKREFQIPRRRGIEHASLSVQDRLHAAVAQVRTKILRLPVGARQNRDIPRERAGLPEQFDNLVAHRPVDPPPRRRLEDRLPVLAASHKPDAQGPFFGRVRLLRGKHLVVGDVGVTKGILRVENRVLRPDQARDRTVIRAQGGDTQIRRPLGVPVGVDIGSAKSVNRLLRIADQKHCRAGASEDEAKDIPLQGVRVLKLVDEGRPVALAQKPPQMRPPEGVGKGAVQVGREVVVGQQVLLSLQYPDLPVVFLEQGPLQPEHAHVKSLAKRPAFGQKRVAEVEEVVPRRLPVLFGAPPDLGGGETLEILEKEGGREFPPREFVHGRNTTLHLHGGVGFPVQVGRGKQSEQLLPVSWPVPAQTTEHFLEPLSVVLDGGVRRPKLHFGAFLAKPQKFVQIPELQRAVQHELDEQGRGVVNVFAPEIKDQLALEIARIVQDIALRRRVAFEGEVAQNFAAEGVDGEDGRLVKVAQGPVQNGANGCARLLPPFPERENDPLPQFSGGSDGERHHQNPGNRKALFQKQPQVQADNVVRLARPRRSFDQIQAFQRTTCRVKLGIPHKGFFPPSCMRRQEENIFTKGPGRPPGASSPPCFSRSVSDRRS